MSDKEAWRSLGVWRCGNAMCSEQWASEGDDCTCPFCDATEIEKTDFTCGELADAQEAFGFAGELPVHIPQPVPSVVQLSTLPQECWIGLGVFHPVQQQDDLPDWRFFDVGVVVNIHADPDWPEEIRCEFVAGVMGDTTTLRYPPRNLWVASVLAERIVH